MSTVFFVATLLVVVFFLSSLTQCQTITWPQPGGQQSSSIFDGKTFTDFKISAPTPSTTPSTTTLVIRNCKIKNLLTTSASQLFINTTIIIENSVISTRLFFEHMRFSGSSSSLSITNCRFEEEGAQAAPSVASSPMLFVDNLVPLDSNFTLNISHNLFKTNSTSRSNFSSLVLGHYNIFALDASKTMKFDSIRFDNNTVEKSHKQGTAFEVMTHQRFIGRLFSFSGNVLHLFDSRRADPIIYTAPFINYQTRSGKTKLFSVMLDSIKKGYSQPQDTEIDTVLVVGNKIFDDGGSFLPAGSATPKTSDDMAGRWMVAIADTMIRENSGRVLRVALAVHLYAQNTRLISISHNEIRRPQLENFALFNESYFSQVQTNFSLLKTMQPYQLLSQQANIFVRINMANNVKLIQVNNNIVHAVSRASVIGCLVYIWRAAGIEHIEMNHNDVLVTRSFAKCGVALFTNIGDGNPAYVSGIRRAHMLGNKVIATIEGPLVDDTEAPENIHKVNSNWAVENAHEALGVWVYQADGIMGSLGIDDEILFANNTVVIHGRILALAQYAGPALRNLGALRFLSSNVTVVHRRNLGLSRSNMRSALQKSVASCSRSTSRFRNVSSVSFINIHCRMSASLTWNSAGLHFATGATLDGVGLILFDSNHIVHEKISYDTYEKTSGCMAVESDAYTPVARNWGTIRVVNNFCDSRAMQDRAPPVALVGFALGFSKFSSSLKRLEVTDNNFTVRARAGTVAVCGFSALYAHPTEDPERDLISLVVYAEPIELFDMGDAYFARNTIVASSSTSVMGISFSVSGVWQGGSLILDSNTIRIDSGDDGLAACGGKHCYGIGFSCPMADIFVAAGTFAFVPNDMEIDFFCRKQSVFLLTELQIINTTVSSARGAIGMLAVIKAPILNISQFTTHIVGRNIAPPSKTIMPQKQNKQLFILKFGYFSKLHKKFFRPQFGRVLISNIDASIDQEDCGVDPPLFLDTSFIVPARDELPPKSGTTSAPLFTMPPGWQSPFVTINFTNVNVTVSCQSNSDKSNNALSIVKLPMFVSVLHSSITRSKFVFKNTPSSSSVDVIGICPPANEDEITLAAQQQISARINVTDVTILTNTKSPTTKLFSMIRQTASGDRSKFLPESTFIIARVECMSVDDDPVASRKAPIVFASHTAQTDIRIVPCHGILPSFTSTKSLITETFSNESTKSSEPTVTLSTTIPFSLPRAGISEEATARLVSASAVAGALAAVFANSPAAILAGARGAALMRLALCELNDAKPVSKHKELEKNFTTRKLSRPLSFPMALLPGLTFGDPVGGHFRAVVVVACVVVGLTIIVALFVGSINKSKWSEYLQKKRRQFEDERYSDNSSSRSSPSSSSSRAKSINRELAALRPYLNQDVGLLSVVSFAPIDRTVVKVLCLLVPFVAEVSGDLLWAGLSPSDTALAVVPLLFVVALAIFIAIYLWRSISPLPGSSDTKKDKKKKRNENSGGGNDDERINIQHMWTDPLRPKQQEQQEIIIRPQLWTEASGVYVPRGTSDGQRKIHLFLQHPLGRWFFVGAVAWETPFLDMDTNVLQPGPSVQTTFGYLFNTYKGPIRQENTMLKRWRSAASSSSSTSPRSPSRHNKENETPLFDNSWILRLCPIWLYVILVATLIVCLLVGIGDASPLSCRTAYFVAFAVTLPVTVGTIILRPYIVPFRSVCLIAIEVCTLFAGFVFLGVLSYSHHTDEPAPQPSQSAVVAGQLLSTLPAVIVGVMLMIAVPSRSLLLLIGKARAVCLHKIRTRLVLELDHAEELMQLARGCRRSVAVEEQPVISTTSGGRPRVSSRDI